MTHMIDCGCLGAAEQRQRQEKELETCEDRGWTCCERLTPAEHLDRYGYPQSGQEVIE